MTRHVTSLVLQPSRNTKAKGSRNERKRIFDLAGCALTRRGEVARAIEMQKGIGGLNTP